MQLSTFCFFTATLAALAGMSLGIYMGLQGDFTLAPAHAHLNLLGWVTLALYGLYHRGVTRDGNRLAWTQVGFAAAGFPLMSGGLAAYLTTGNGAFINIVIVGALCTLAAMLLFLAVVLRDARQSLTTPPIDANLRAYGW